MPTIFQSIQDKLSQIIKKQEADTPPPNPNPVGVPQPQIAPAPPINLPPDVFLDAVPPPTVNNAENIDATKESRAVIENRERQEQLNRRRLERMKPRVSPKEFKDEQDRAQAEREAQKAPEPEEVKPEEMQVPPVADIPQPKDFIEDAFGMIANTFGVDLDSQIEDIAGPDNQPVDGTDKISDTTEIVPTVKSFSLYPAEDPNKIALHDGNVYFNGDLIEITGSIFTSGVYIHTFTGTTYGYIVVNEDNPDYTVVVDNGGFPDPADNEQVIPLFMIGTMTVDGKKFPDLDNMKIYNDGDILTGKSGEVEWPETFTSQYMVLQKLNDGENITENMIFDYVRGIDA